MSCRQRTLALEVCPREEQEARVLPRRRALIDLSCRAKKIGMTALITLSLISFGAFERCGLSRIYFVPSF
jgi:hypothetical protein